MASKLTDITASFHTFETDQVLTAGQLNEVVNYFDDQERLARINLSGVGIVCGFTLDNKTSADKIVIRQGVGITTDGDLVQLQAAGSTAPLKSVDLASVTYTHFRPFLDTNAHYKHFQHNDAQVKLWELLPAQENTEETLDKLTDLDKMVALLYIESYEDKESLCEGLSCDNQGINQVAALRVLLTSQSDASLILKGDELFNKHDLMQTYLQLGDLQLKRILIPNDIDDPKVLANCFNLQPETTLINTMKTGVNLMGTKMKDYYDSPLFASIVLSMTQKLVADATTVEMYYQYRYDLLRDVLQGYNELKDAFLELITECCPAMDSFPKHLMLGKVNPTDDDELTGRYRHRFMRSPATAGNSKEFKRFTLLLQRLDEQLKAYPTLPETDNKALVRPEVKITPSRYRAPLGQKAIPFYYKVTSPLLNAWDSDKTFRGKQTHNTAYDTTLLALPDPLVYSLAPYDFLNIAGHQGADYREVIKTLDAYKRKYGLSFDVKAIGIYEDPDQIIDPEEYECEFEDLSVLLKAWVREQECNLASVTSLISAFSLKEPGRNIKESTFIPRKGFVPLENIQALTTNEDPTVGAAPAPVSTSGMLKPVFASAAIFAAPEQKTEQQETLALNSRYRQSNNTVIQNLTVVEGTVGHSVLKGIRANIGGSAQDIINDAGIHAFDIAHEDDETTWDTAIYTALVENSIEILSYSHVLANSIPLSVADINDEIIANYNTNISRLCLVLKRIQVSQKNTKDMTKTNDAILGLLINQLSSICCSSKQLQTLLEEIDDRKRTILTRLTLAEFVKEHPGLEHLGGVVPGGTFVLVYLKAGVLDSGTVLADFSLPYMCCADCAPINYIIPKANVRLNLPKSIFCLGNDVSPMIFQVDPPEGIITASLDVEGIYINGTELHIDAETFPEEHYNKVITFKVDDQPTDCQLRIVKPVSAQFLVPADQPVTDTLIHFKPIASIPEGAKFHWDFGDGETSSLKEPSHNYKLPVNATNTVTVKLTITPPGGACPSTATNEIEFEQVSVDIEPKVFCINDQRRHEFIIKPDGATAVISIQGVTADNKGFVPANSIVGEQTVYVNGEQAFTVQINPVPGVNASASIDNNILQLSGSASDATDVAWTFLDMNGNKVCDSKTEIKLNVSLSEFYNIQPGAQFKAILSASNLCGSKETAITLTYPANTEACTTDATMDIRKLRNQVIAVVDDPDTMKRMTALQRELFLTTRDFFSKITDLTPVYLAGNANTDMTQKVTGLLDKIFEEIIKGERLPGSAGFEFMSLLYQWLMEMYFTVYQCQDEQQWKSTSTVLGMMERQLSKDVEGSFPNKGYDIDPDKAVENYLVEVLNFRAEGTISYDRLRKVIGWLE